MTTPGGGGPNRIEIQTDVVPGEDAAAVARRMGEQAGRDFAEGVAAAGPAHLNVSADELAREMDAALTQVERRAEETAARVRRAVRPQGAPGAVDVTRQMAATEAELEAQEVGRAQRRSVRTSEELRGLQERIRLLGDIQRLTREMQVSPGVLGLPAQEQLRRTGSQIGGQAAVRTPEGFRVATAGGELGPALSEAEALARVQQQVATATEAAAVAADRQTASAERQVPALNALTRGQWQMALAEEQLARAEKAQDDVAILRAQQALVNANRAEAAERRQQDARQRGFLGNVMHGVFGPARGGEDEQGANAFLRLRSDTGEFLGAIARYQAAYAIIFGLSQGFNALLQSEVQLQDVMVEFSDATGVAANKSRDLVNTLGDLGAPAGFSIAQSLTAATRGIFAFGNEVDRSPDGSPNTDQATQVGQESARAAAMAALISRSQDANATQQQLIATTRGFNLTAGDQTRVLDAVTNAYQNFGAEIGDILTGLPSVATVAREAGLSIEQTANMISLGISGSGLSGTGVASLFNRFVGNFNERPQTRTLLQGLGVDATGTAGQTLENLAQSWDRLSEAQRNEVVTALGGHEVAKVLLPILEQGDRLVQANATSYEHLGRATELYYDRLHNISGMVRTLGGDLQSLGHDLAQSGFLTVLGAGLEILHPLLRGMDDVLRAMEQLNDASGGILIPMTELAALLVVIGRQLERNAATQALMVAETEEEAVLRAAGAAGAGLRGAEQAVGSGFRGGVRAGFRGGAAAVEGAEVGAAARASSGVLSTAGRSVGALAGAMLGPAGLIVGLLAVTAATGAYVEALHNERDARKQARDAQASLQGATTVEQLRAAASNLGNAAVTQRHANSGLFGYLVSRPEDRSRPGELEAQGKYAAQEADRIESEQARLARVGGRLGDFFTNTGDRAADLSNGLASMTAAGVPAVRQLQLLSQALGSVGAAGATATGGTGPFRSELTTASFVSAALDPSLLGAHKSYNFYTDRQEDVSSADPAKIREGINKALDEANIQPGQAIPDDVMNKISLSILKSVGLDGSLTASLVADPLRRALANAGATQSNPFQGLSSDEFKRSILGDDKGNGSLIKAVQGLSGLDDPRAPDASNARLRQTVITFQQFASQAVQAGQGGDALVALFGALHQAESDYVTSEVSRLERLRKAAVSRAGTPEEVAAVNARYVTQEARAAIVTGDETGLIAILDSASDATRAAVRHTLVAEFNAAEAAFEHAQAVFTQLNAEWAAWDSIPGAIRSKDPDLAGQRPNTPRPLPPDATGVQRTKAALGLFDDASNQSAGGGGDSDADSLAVAQINARHRAGDAVGAARDALDAARYTFAHAKTTTDKANALRQLKDAEYAYDQALHAYTQAVNSAQARPGDPLSAAAVSLNNAREALDQETRGTTAWQQAQASYRQAQYAYNQAVLEHGDKVYRLGIDNTNPVSTARADLYAARRRLATDQKNGTGDIVQDQLDVQAANARLQAAAFSQRLQDVQFAHEMGRMSDRAYLSYLQSQHDSLTAVAHRSRQQTEELQQIDQLLKSAADQLQGQWNIGDIRIPTPYEARRYIQAASQGQSYLASTTTNQNTFSFSGLDRSEVISILQAVLGGQVTSVLATTPRKVS